MYKLVRGFFFLLDAEKAHYMAMNMLSTVCKLPFGSSMIRRLCRPNTETAVQLFGVTFKNNIGLAAGFDKNARWLKELALLGFGSVEIGTVTPLGQGGNPKPRLFRIKGDKALINRMGFNNDGVDEIVARLASWREAVAKGKAMPIIIGGNIGKNKTTPNELAWQDYVKCFSNLHPYVDYFVVNVSSPNTPNLRALQDKESLRTIFEKLAEVNNTITQRKPILLKIAPDLSPEQVDDVIALTNEIRIDGLVVSNTTLDRTTLSQEGQHLAIHYGAGGLSGAPIKQKATKLIAYIHSKTNVPIVGSGGIFTADDAVEKTLAGATLLQVWTGFIYQGPSIVKQLLTKK
jgi:dihydroorotate dehydrogenase